MFFVTWSIFVQLELSDTLTSIFSLNRTSIKGALWYQGESNAGWNRDKYQCTFPAMIETWRKLWSSNTGTAPDFPFGFVQLSTWTEGDLTPGFPVIRWHQTADQGFVPNDIMKVRKSGKK